MVKTVIAFVLCFLFLCSIGFAAGPAAFPSAPGGFPAPAGGPLPGTPSLAAPSGSGAETTLNSIPGQSSPTLQTNSPAGSNADASAQQSSDGKSVPKNEGPKTEKAATPMPDGKGHPAEASPIEKSLSEDSMVAILPQSFSVGQVAQFGYSFFRPDAAGFAPLTDIPVGPDYIIGVGDRIVLTLWGSIDGRYELEVNRSGEVSLPKVGTVNVAGITYGKLPQVLRKHLGKVFKDFELDVTIGKLRLLKVYLVGEVRAPGDYTISSLSTLINALAAAGGPTKNGTLRTIQIKRNGKTVETVDLYDFFLKGDKSKDIRLQSGDTVFVPTIGPVAGIAGNVRRPAIYELKGEKTLKDVLALADGINSGGYLQRVQIARIIAHEKKVVADFNLDPASTGKSEDELIGSIAIQDMDMVKVFPIDTTLRGSLRLDGYVRRPGNYALKPGMHIRDILLQDNLLPEFHQGIGEITRLYPPDYHPEKVIFNPAKALTGDPAHNLELKEFDVVRIFFRWEMEEMPKVRISGEVQKPGKYRFFQNLTVRDLLLMAGNPRLTAYLKNAEITRIKKTGESVTSFSISINLEEALNNNPQHNIPLEPFDELVVRKIPNWADETERYVVLSGEFRFPGLYPIFKGEKLSSVIERAGGFSDKAYLRAARFTRETLRVLQQQRMDEMLVKSEEEILKKQVSVASTASSKEELEATKTALEGLQRTVALLKTKKAEGRLVIRLDALDTLKGSPYDVEVIGGDMLVVPQMPNAVSVLGQVYNQTSFVPIPGEDVTYYMEKAGGPTRDAEEDDIYIVRTDGTVVSRQQASVFKNFFSGKSLFSAGFMSSPLEPGDTIIVPQKFEKIAWMREIKDISVILGNLALAAGVMVAAGL